MGKDQYTGLSRGLVQKIESCDLVIQRSAKKKKSRVQDWTLGNTYSNREPAWSRIVNDNNNKKPKKTKLLKQGESCTSDTQRLQPGKKYLKVGLWLSTWVLNLRAPPLITGAMLWLLEYYSTLKRVLSQWNDQMKILTDGDHRHHDQQDRSIER